ncbi:MAG: FeoB-associated Cys-rich membrane protein [Bacteroidales bacterium]|nr:FeoB-associated Cys-rich membrane protein [Bacteroidales bacterium]
MQMIITISIVIAATVGLIVKLFKRKKRSGNCNPSSICDSCSQLTDCSLKKITDSRKKS